jgi:hypothetical protein
MNSKCGGTHNRGLVWTSLQSTEATGKRGLVLSLATHRQQGKQMSKVSVYHRKYTGVMRRVLGNFPGGIYLKADSTKVTQRLYEKGFCKKSGHPIANFKYLNNTQHATVLQMVYILRGLANYYKLANNSRQMISHWNYIIRFSIAKMFAAKFRLGSIAKVFALAGKDLSRPIKKDSLKMKKEIIRVKKRFSSI